MRPRTALLACLCLLALGAGSLLFATRGGDAPVSGPRPQGQNVPILTYHKVDEEPACSSCWVSRRVFERQMAALRAYGYTAVSFRDMVRAKTGGGSLPERPVILTFDDGYECVYRVARPVLNAYGFRATVFLTAGHIGEDRRRDNSWDAGERGCPAGMMLWREAAAMQAEGHRLEAHSLSHPRLSALRPVRAWREMAGAKTAIERRLGAEATCFAFPFGAGAASPLLRLLAGLAGYRAAVSYKTGMADLAGSDLMALPRIKITEEHSPDLDPARPEHFFMRIVDPAFPLPAISVERIELAGGAGPAFRPGDTLAMTVHARNSGDTAIVSASLALYPVGEGAAVPAVESLPAAGARQSPFPAGSSVPFRYAWKIPGSAPAGRHRLRFTVRDEHGVFSYFDGSDPAWPQVRIAPPGP